MLTSCRGIPRVLVVDDHDQLRASICRMLRGRLDVVGEASNGFEAVEMAREIHPDLVLMDVRMPVMDGIEATRLIHAEMPDVRIVGHSAFHERELVEEMIDAGAECYLVKGELALVDFVSSLNRD